MCPTDTVRYGIFSTLVEVFPVSRIVLRLITVSYQGGVKIKESPFNSLRRL